MKPVKVDDPTKINFIETFSGGMIAPLQPKIGDIRIEDIAHALSMQCRFTGHTRKFYSVAEHCIRVSYVAASEGRQADALWGLLHDASEAYLHDIASPVKHQPEFELYRAAEDRLEKLIFRRFGLRGERPPSVKLADLILLATEARDLMPMNNQLTYGPCAPLPSRITPMSPRKAEVTYLARFYELIGAKNV